MSTTNIQLLRSNVLSKRPAASVLLDGQVAVNYHYQEPGLYFRLTNGRLTKVGPVAYSNDGSFPNAVPAGEPGNLTGEEWLDGRISYDSPILKVYDGNKWVAGSGFTVNDATGDLAIDRDIECNTLRADSLDLSGDLVLDSDLLTVNDCVDNIGQEAARFNTAWLCYADVKENLTVGQDIVGNHVILTGDLLSRNLTTNGDTILGSGAASRTIVNSRSEFEFDGEFKGGLIVRFATNTQDLQVLGNTIIGTSCSNTLRVIATSQFDCDVTFGGSVSFPSTPIEDAIFGGNILLGQSCANDTLTIEAATTLKCDVVPNIDSTVNLGSPTQRFANVYTGDLHLKNDHHVAI